MCYHTHIMCYGSTSLGGSSRSMWEAGYRRRTGLWMICFICNKRSLGSVMSTGHSNTSQSENSKKKRKEKVFVNKQWWNLLSWGLFPIKVSENSKWTINETSQNTHVRWSFMQMTESEWQTQYTISLIVSLGNSRSFQDEPLSRRS